MSANRNNRKMTSGWSGIVEGIAIAAIKNANPTPLMASKYTVRKDSLDGNLKNRKWEFACKINLK